MVRQLSLIPTGYLQKIRQQRAPRLTVCPICRTIYNPGPGRALGCSFPCMLQARFWRQVECTATCWLWQGAMSRGYGTITGKHAGHKQTWYAHRLAYEWFVGPIPEGRTIDHLCRQTRCVNPAHLEPVSRTENTMRGTSFGPVNKAKTHCPLGHAYDTENTMFDAAGWRTCRTCKRRIDNAAYARKKAALGQTVRRTKRRKPSE